MMAEQRERSPFRFLWRLALIRGLIVVVILGLGLGYLYSLPRPDKAVLAEADRKYEQVRALYPKLATPAPVSSQTPTQPKNHTQSTTESLQARCDRLFRELLLPTEIMTALDTRELDSKLENARELAAMYDSGIRVSDEARNLYRLAHADAFRYIAQSLAEGRHPGDPMALQFGTTWTAREQDPVVRARLFENLVTALKFLRVADCPVPQSGIYQEFVVVLQPPFNGAGPLRALPPELMTMDLNLLAPRRALDWPRCMALALEQCREQRKFWENMLDTGFVFDRLYEMESRARAREPWSSKAYGYCRSVAGSLIISRKQAPAVLDYFRSVETNFEDYATSCAKSAAPIPADSVMMQFDFHQLQARLIAGALALRRGEPVPSPDQIGPDSYFYDPVMQRPYILRASNIGRETGLLEVLRPFRFSNGRVQQIMRINIALPANHPGLEKIQRTP